MDLSTSMQAVLQIAAAEAHFHCNAGIEPEHLVLAICKLESFAGASGLPYEVNEEIRWVSELFERAGLSPSAVRRRLRTLMRKAEQFRGNFTGHRSQRCREVCLAAEEFAREEGDSTVGIRHFLITLIVDASPVLREAITNLEGRWTLLRQGVGLEGANGGALPTQPIEGKPGPAAPQLPRRGTRRKREPLSKTPFLDRFGRDVTALAREGKLMPCIGRKQEMRQIAQVLRRRTKSNPVLVGDAGVGKTCVVEGLAQRAVAQGALEALSSWRIVEISMGSLVAGAKYRGELEERLERLIREAAGDPNLMIFIDEIHTLVGAGGSSSQGMDAGQILKPALARGEIRVIGATTITEYRKYIESDAALERRFQMVWVDEPSREETIQILTGLRPKFEEHHGLRITDAAVAKAVEFSTRFLTEHRLPDKAIDLIDQACASRMLATLSADAQERPSAPEPLRPEDIARVVAQKCRIPVDILTEDEQERLRGMAAALSKRVMGQDEAVRQVAETVRTARLGLKDARRPAGVFLFLGPTGTGKTELARALAEFLFGSENALIRFDMSEYKERHEVAKFIGAPPGYIGHDAEGQLISKVRTKPYSVVLFDEIEKAHPEIYDLMLQVFDEGRLTDAKGRRADFRECTMIMTSNLGCRWSKRELEARTVFGFRQPRRTSSGGDDTAGSSEAADSRYVQAVLAEVRDFFRPELLNRIQKQLVFCRLTRDVLRAVLTKFVAALNRRLEDRKITVRLSPQAEEKLVSDGYDDVYGARALERVFETQISERLAAALLEGRVRDGQNLEVTVDDDGYSLESK